MTKRKCNLRKSLTQQSNVFISCKAQISLYFDYSAQDFGIEYTPKKNTKGIFRKWQNHGNVVVLGRSYDLKKWTTASIIMRFQTCDSTKQCFHTIPSKVPFCILWLYSLGWGRTQHPLPVCLFNFIITSFLELK